MSFKFNWQFFDVADLQARCQEALTASIAQTRRPPSITAPIRVTNVDFGTHPPQLKFKSIPAVGLNKTHIVFALKYRGDASVTLTTEIQANVLIEHLDNPDFPEFVKPKVIGAQYGLALPFMLKIKSLVLDTLIDVVYTPSGVLVNFNDDPLKSLDIESSLDSFPFVHSMINKLLKDQLTVSFYEDIPESVWASTNPNKEHPDPFYGPRRWSRHDTTFAKAASFLYPSLGPAHRPELEPFQTLALNTPNSNWMQQPVSILSRACLRNYTNTKNINEAGEKELLSSGKLNNFLVESSSISISSSSTAGYSGNSPQRSFKPKRRVISMRKISQKPTSSHSSSGSSNSTSTSTPTVGSPSLLLSPAQSQPQSQSPSTSSFSSFGGNGSGSDHIGGGNQTQLKQRVTSRRASNRTLSSSEGTNPATTSNLLTHGYKPTSSHSRSASKHSSPRAGGQKIPYTPLLRSSEFSLVTEDDYPYIDDTEESLLPPVLNWDHRRFSSPDGIDDNLMVKPRLQKQRSSSFQQLDSSQLAASSITSTPRSPLASRAPVRYSSTNDLMTK